MTREELVNLMSNASTYVDGFEYSLKREECEKRLDEFLAEHDKQIKAEAFEEYYYEFEQLCIKWYNQSNIRFLIDIRRCLGDIRKLKNKLQEQNKW